MSDPNNTLPAVEPQDQYSIEDDVETTNTRSYSQGQLVLRRFLRHKAAMVSLIVLVFVVLIAFYGLFFATVKLRNSGWGLVTTFALTGFMGYTLGPIIGYYLGLPNGGQTVMMAMAGTAVIFLSLSGYALTTRKDFSFMGGFLSVGILVAFLAGLAAVFFEIPALSLTVSVMTPQRVVAASSS